MVRIPSHGRGCGVQSRKRGSVTVAVGIRVGVRGRGPGLGSAVVEVVQKNVHGHEVCAQPTMKYLSNCSRTNRFHDPDCSQALGR